MAGVVCAQCGASTPLPADLRIATFACQLCAAELCAAELSTASYAGTGAVRVDELRAFLHAAVDEPRPPAAAQARPSKATQARATHPACTAVLRSRFARDHDPSRDVRELRKTGPVRRSSATSSG